MDGVNIWKLREDGRSQHKENSRRLDGVHIMILKGDIQSQSRDT